MHRVLLQCSNVTASHADGHGSSFIPVLLLAVFFALYVLAVIYNKEHNRRWNHWRTASFITGCIMVAIAISPAVIHAGHHSFRVHMLQHLILGMAAPIALVLGAPILLALQTLPLKGARILSKVLSSGCFHVISHPVTALVLNIGGMYLLYLTPLYNSLHNNPGIHYLVHFHFLAAGYLFTWSIIGPDPAPRRPKLTLRMVALFASIAAHAFLSKYMFAYNYPRNSIHPAADIQQAAKLMYYGGDIIELLLVIALFAIWYQKKGKPHYKLVVG